MHPNPPNLPNYISPGLRHRLVSRYIRPLEDVKRTISHEVGHVIIGAGHPDEGQGEVPLHGTDHTRRLVASERGRNPGHLIVKKEWDAAEAWFTKEEDDGRLSQ